MDLLTLDDATFLKKWAALKKHQRDAIPQPERQQLFDRYIALITHGRIVNATEQEAGWNATTAPNRGNGHDEPPADDPPFNDPPDDELTPLDAYELEGQTRTENPPATPLKSNGEGYALNPTAESLGVVSRRLSDVAFKPVDWLWKDKIPCGKVSMIVGNPGLGKSQVCASLAAVITTGGQWPVTRERAPLGSVIILSAEDDADDTIGPRMEAAGADCSKIRTFDAIRTVEDNGQEIIRGFNIMSDVASLVVLMREMGDVRLVIIDPISAYLGTLDSHKNSDVRGAMVKLKDAAAEVGAGVIIVNHLNKSQGQDALLKSQGSVGFVAAARAVWGVAKDKENPQRRLFMPLKNNLGTDETGLAYSIESHQLAASDPAIHTSKVMWETKPVNMSAEEVFASNSDEEQGAVADAKAFLQDVLASGPVKVISVQAQARKANHALSTLRRAKEQLKITSRRTGFGQDWEWALPETKGSRSYADRED